MNKKLIIQAVIVVVVIVVGAAAVAYFKHGPNSSEVALDPNLVAPSGSVMAISADSISIQQQDGLQKTFSVSPETRVISQVSSGQVGKGLADIAVGTMVIIRPSTSNSAAADSIEISAALGASGSASESSSPSGTPVSLLGSVVSISPSALVVKPEGATTSVQVTVTKQTVVRSNVLAGEKGKTYEDIAVGSPVFVAGTTGGDSVIANSIQLLVVVNQPEQ